MANYRSRIIGRNELSNMVNKIPSPWSADFYRTNTVKTLDDTIEHGGPGSGRYPKGSGKDKIARKKARTIGPKDGRSDKATFEHVMRDVRVNRKNGASLLGGQRIDLSSDDIKFARTFRPATEKQYADASKKSPEAYAKLVEKDFWKSMSQQIIVEELYLRGYKTWPPKDSI